MTQEETLEYLLAFLEGNDLLPERVVPFETLSDHFIAYYTIQPESIRIAWCSALSELYCYPRTPFLEFVDAIVELVSAIAFRTDRRELLRYRERFECIILEPNRLATWVNANDEDINDPSKYFHCWHYALSLYSVLFMLGSQLAEESAELLMNNAKSIHFKTALRQAKSRCTQLRDCKRQ